MVSVGIIFAYFTDNFRSGYAIPHLQSSKEHAVLHDFYHITRDPYKVRFYRSIRCSSSFSFFAHLLKLVFFS